MFPDGAIFSYTSRSTTTIRSGIDLDLAEVFPDRASSRSSADGSPADDLGHYAAWTSTPLLHQAALWARARRIRPTGTGRWDGHAGKWVGVAAILLRRPRWRAETELRRNYEAGERVAALAAARAELGPEEPGRVAVDLAEIDAVRRSHGNGFAAGNRRPRTAGRLSAERGSREAARLPLGGPPVQPRGITAEPWLSRPIADEPRKRDRPGGDSPALRLCSSHIAKWRLLSSGAGSGGENLGFAGWSDGVASVTRARRADSGGSTQLGPRSSIVVTWLIETSVAGRADTSHVGLPEDRRRPHRRSEPWVGDFFGRPSRADSRADSPRERRAGCRLAAAPHLLHFRNGRTSSGSIGRSRAMASSLW